MLIIGNSHVSLFQKGVQCSQEPVKVKWVGAFIVDWFKVNHPGAQLIKDEFEKEQSWKVLFVGNHDIHHMLRKSSHLGLEKAFEELCASYKELFLELNQFGNFIWAISIQQATNVNIPPYQTKDIIKISQHFYSEMKIWCLENGILTLDPLLNLYDQGGLLPSQYLEEDELHIKETYSNLFLEPLGRLTNLNLRSTPRVYDVDFDPNVESQAYASLVLNDLELLSRSSLNKKEELFESLGNFISKVALQRGVNYTPQLGDDFISSGVMDSLNLVELYSYASELLSKKIEFDVNLRDYNTLEKLVPFIVSQIQGPFYEDFVESSQLSWEENQTQLLEVHQRISELPKPLVSDFLQAVFASTQNSHQYGIVYFWEALFRPEHRESLLKKACNTKLKFPVSEAMCQSYLTKLVMPKAIEPMTLNLVELGSEIFKLKTLVKDGNAGQVQSQLENYLKQWPEHIELKLLEAQVFLQLMDYGRVSKALDKLDQIWPYFAEVYYLRARVEFEKSNKIQALSLLEYALKLHPKYHQAIELGKQIQGSVVNKKHQIQINPKSIIKTNDSPTSIQLENGNVADLTDIERMYHLGQYGEAHQALMKVVRSEVDHIDAYVLLAQVFNQLGKSQSSIDLLKGALDISPHRQDIQLLLSQLQGEKVSPIKAGAIEVISPNSKRQIFELLGKSNLSKELQLPSYEIEFLREIYTIDPLFEDIAERLKTLESQYTIHSQPSFVNTDIEHQDIEGLIQRAIRKNYKVTALVSTYASEKFIRGCLEDLEAQSIAQDIEIMVINSGSPENEDAIVREFLEKYDNITYIHTHREKLYTAWNRGIKLAQGQYITNANTDDRHRFDCLEVLATALDNHPECAVSYGNSIITDNVDCKFEDANILRKHEWLPYSYMNLLRKCEVGPQPMWRASIHDDIGYYSDKYTVVGDYDFWLRIAEKYPLYHVAEELGLYLTHDNNLEHQNQEGTFLESSEVKWKYIERFVKSNPFSSVELAKELDHHLGRVSELMNEVKQTQKVANLNLFEYHFYTLALLKLIQGNVMEARSLCLSFFSLVGQSKNVAHLYRKLLVEKVPPRHNFQQTPLVSIIVPLYNQGIYMEDTITSVINQNYSNWELIIVNDGSTDDSYEVTTKLIAQYPNHKITLLTHENKGKTYTRNRGVESCRGEYICILDSDDQIASTYLETAVKTFADNPDVGWITPYTLQFGPTVNQLQYNFKQDFINMLTVCLAPVSAIYRKSMYDDINGYSEMFTREDWEFWIKAGERGWQGVVTSEVEFMYRIKENRWGLKPENNRRSKTDLYNLHPWWYKNFDVTSREKVFDLSTGCHLPADYLDSEAVAIYQRAPKNSRQDVIHLMEQIKSRFESLNPQFQKLPSTAG